VEIRGGEPWMQMQQALGTVGEDFGGGLDELVGCGGECQRQLLDALDEGGPGRESELARDDRLSVVECDRSGERGVVELTSEAGQSPEARERGGVTCFGGTQQVLRLPLELLEIRSLG
jgi:hypothetical protein